MKKQHTTRLLQGKDEGDLEAQVLKPRRDGEVERKTSAGSEVGFQASFPGVSEDVHRSIDGHHMAVSREKHFSAEPSDLNPTGALSVA